MRVVTKKRLDEYSKTHPTSRIALIDWHKKVKSIIWNNLADVKNTFNSVDYVGSNRYIFNIKGNQYRIVVIIKFASKKVYIRFIGTHSEYDKIDCNTV